MSRRPLFVLSLPRSGSTLVQRVLASHPEIATTPEPWLLLPQLYAMREHGWFAEYGHVTSARAIREFATRLPGGVQGYEEELRGFVTRLYELAASSPGTYFLDKTPRYHFIADDLFRVFPDAKFVFLWRNPLAIVASIVETWARGRWSIERWHVDLFDGVTHLAAAREAHGDTAYACRFEDLVADPTQAWVPLFEHLGLEFDPTVLSAFASLTFDARMGDPTGANRYRTLSTEPLDKWKRVLSNPYRKRWAERYLRWIGEDRLAMMGYSLGDLLAELDAAPTTLRRLASDPCRALYWKADRIGRERAAALLWRRLPR